MFPGLFGDLWETFPGEATSAATASPLTGSFIETVVEAVGHQFHEFGDETTVLRVEGSSFRYRFGDGEAGPD